MNLRSGRTTRSSGPRTRSQNKRKSTGNARPKKKTGPQKKKAAPTRRVEIVVRFGPRKGKKTTPECLTAGSQLKTQKTSSAGKTLRACRTNKRS